MGQWSWFRLHGQSSQVLRVVLAYWPCYSMSPLSTYQQQVRYLARMNCTDLPKNLFLSDLIQVVLEWQVEGDLIILSTDLNKDIRDQKIQTMLKTVGLVEITTALYMQQAPATHNRGSLPIDGIFMPVTLLDLCHEGYLVFGDEVPSNHQVVWLDIPMQSVCPMKSEPIECPIACWLQFKDPRVVTKYNQILWELLSSSGMAARAQALMMEVKSRLSQTQQAEYKAIDKAAMEYRHHTEKNCWKSMLEQYSGVCKCLALSTAYYTGREYGDVL